MYNKQRGFGRGGFKNERGGGFEKRMHPAVCAKCGDHCEVPFKPNGRKPVHCSNCFVKDDNFAPKRFDRSERPAGDSGVAAQLREINDKLDAIIDALND